MSTKVVNLRYKDYDVFIGRAGRGHDGYFGNPYVLSNEKDRQWAIDSYKKYFYDRLEKDPEFKRRVLELKNKTLGCFCAPKLCHGDIIAEYLDNQ